MYRSKGTLAALLLLSSMFAPLACEDDSLSQFQAMAQFVPSSLSFGEVGLGLTQVLPVTFENTSAGPFQVDSAEGAPSFIVKGLEEDRTIGGGVKLEIEASFVAVAEGPRNETLVVKDGDVEVRLDLSATGIMQMVPQLVLNPSMLDFGVVEIGTTARLAFALDNTGNANGTIESGTFRSGGSVYTIRIPGPLIVAPGIRGVFLVEFTPTREGVFGDELVLDIAELPEPILVGMTGEGGDPAGAIFCQPAAAVFEEVPRGNTSTLDLQCSARGGVVTITSVEIEGGDGLFTLVLAEPLVTLQPDGRVTIPVKFTPEGLPADHLGTLRIGYTNERGPFEVEVPLSGRTGPPPPDNQAISATLRWDLANTDIDLHLVRPDGDLGDSYTDCFYDNKEPDWGAAGDRTDNPYLDVDDVDGFGPETINLARAEDGEYDLYLRYFDARGNGTSVATINVYVSGINVANITSEPMEHHDVLHVGRVEWENGAGSFEEINSMSCTCAKTPARGGAGLALFFGGLVLVLLGARRR